jgi:hypothetical protein
MLRGFVVFTTSEVPDVDYRFDGQALPRGARVLLVEDWRGCRVSLHGYSGPLTEPIERAVRRARAEMGLWTDGQMEVYHDNHRI